MTDNPKPVEIANLCSIGLLRDMWSRHVRKALRANPLDDLYLSADPFQFAAYEWNLNFLLEGLVRDLSSGDYLPEQAELIWSAKSPGLSRPLAFLEPRDALVYKTVIGLVEGDLLRGNRSWASFRRGDKGRTHGGAPLVQSYETDWFATWLNRLGKVSEIANSYDFIVETDIANFFPSIEQSVISELLLGHTRLSRDVVRLVSHLLRLVMPNVLYSEATSRGLPQENLGSSRALAHALLFQLDDEFAMEGQEDRYERYMDDVVVGVHSEIEGYQVLSRIQRVLHRLGLYQNSTKTRVITSEEFITGLMVERNASLDEINHDIAQLGGGPLRTIEDLPVEIFNDLASVWDEHVNQSIQTRPAHWDRVLRRLYTTSRHARDDTRLDRVCDDIWEFPASAKSLLEYVRAFPLTEDLIEKLVEVVRRSRRLYEDIPLLVSEAVATAPISSSTSLSDKIADNFLALIYEEIPRLADPLTLRVASRTAAAATVVLGKFGSLDHHNQMFREVWPKCPADSVLRLQMLPIFAGYGWIEPRLGESEIAGLPWRSALNVNFLQAIATGDEHAVGVALGLINPDMRLMPLRWVSQVRGILLIPLLARSAPTRWAKMAIHALDHLQRNPERLRDFRTEWLITKAL